ncbi:MAG: glycosyltransferase family 4 protein [Terriglobia bacterium]
MVTIDARTFGPTGLGTYVRDLLENLASTDHEFRFRVLCAKPESMAGNPAEKFEFVRATAPIYSLKEQWETARLARGGDLLHCPHYNIPYFYRDPLVVTIHDLTHLTYREFLPNRLAGYYAQFMLRAAARHARQIITVSQFSKKSICSVLHVPEAKVHAILFGPQERLLRRGAPNMRLLESLKISKSYLLFTGLLKPHKNVQGLLRAFASLPTQLLESNQLVLAGKLDSFYPTLRDLARKLSLKDKVVFTGHVSDDELHALYAGATAFVLPSLNEGFGLPVLEAMAYGLPVIVSNTSSLPEVAGNAGVLVDPLDPASIARGIEKVLSDEALRRVLSERSRERARQFSAREFAMRHLEVYRMALDA